MQFVSQGGEELRAADLAVGVEELLDLQVELGLVVLLPVEVDDQLAELAEDRGGLLALSGPVLVLLGLQLPHGRPLLGSERVELLLEAELESGNGLGVDGALHVLRVLLEKKQIFIFFMQIGKMDVRGDSDAHAECVGDGLADLAHELGFRAALGLGHGLLDLDDLHLVILDLSVGRVGTDGDLETGLGVGRILGAKDNRKKKIRNGIWWGYI